MIPMSHGDSSVLWSCKAVWASSKALASGRLDAYTHGKQESDC